MENLVKEHIHDILVQLSKDYSDHLVLAGIVDEKARSIDYHKGPIDSLQLPNRGQRDLDVKVSLIFALAKQFEEHVGALVRTVLTYDDCEIIVLDISPGMILYAICTPGASSDIVDSLTMLVGKIPVRDAGKKWMMTTENDHEHLTADWSGR